MNVTLMQYLQHRHLDGFKLKLKNVLHIYLYIHISSFCC